MKFYKKALLIIAIFLSGALIVSGIAFGPLVKAASSVKKLDEGIYYLEYKGNDGFDSFLEAGGASSSGAMAGYIVHFLSKGLASSEAKGETVSMDYGCSTLNVTSPDGDVLLGRNFDWTQALCIISHVKPKGGYEYISAFDGTLLNFGKDWVPEGFPNQYMALSALFVALDGINEKGLAIADLMAGDDEETHQDRGKPDLTTTCALKYMLSRAADIDEAIALLNTIDMHSDVGKAHHYSMSDASGRSVVVEYVDGEAVVTETRVVTNHYLCREKYLAGKLADDFRQERLEEARESASGTMDENALFESMKLAWQYGHDNDSFQGTQWTEIFNLSHPSLTLCWNRDESSVHKFEISSRH